MKRFDCSESSGVGFLVGMKSPIDGRLNREPLQRRAASLIATRFPRQGQLWVLDRLVYVPESHFRESQGRGPGAALSEAELFALAYTLMGMWWHSIWAQAIERLRVRWCQLGTYFHRHK